MHYDILINNIVVGQLSTATFEALRAEVKRDRRLWAAQVANTLWASWRLTVAVLLVSPALCFHVFALIALFAPAEMEALWRALSADPKAFADAVRQVALLCAVWLVPAAVLTAVICPSRFGFRHIKRERLAEALRLAVGSVAVGETTVRRHADGLVNSPATAS
ncbi:MAG: hypothetical protein HZA63_14675 [Rhodocyclales bacterium]|nr:hypothetical protein [Rhodocyclales bacterium]